MLVRGYASIFSSPDRVKDVVVPGAFSTWLKGNTETRLPLFWMHDHRATRFKEALPVGVATQLRQDSKGPYFEAELGDFPDHFKMARKVSFDTEGHHGG